MDGFNNNFSNNNKNNNNYDENFFDNADNQNVNSDNTFNSNMFNNNQNEGNNSFNNMFNNISNPNSSFMQNSQNSNFGQQQWHGNNAFPQQQVQQPVQQPVQPPNFQQMNQQMPNFNHNINYNQPNAMNNMRPPYADDRIEVEYSMDSSNNHNNNDFRKAYSDDKQRENFSGLNDLNLFDDENENEDELKRAALSYRNKSIMLKILTKGLILLILLGAAVLIYFAATYFLNNNKVSDMKGINDVLSEDDKYKTEYKEKLDKEDFAFLKDEKEQKLKDEDKPARKLQSRFVVEEGEMQNKRLVKQESGSISNILGKESFSAQIPSKPSKSSKPSKPSKAVKSKSSHNSSAKKVSHKPVAKPKVVANSTKTAKTKPKTTAKVATKSVQKSVQNKATSNSVSSASNGYWQVQLYSATDLKQTQQKWRDLRTEYDLFDKMEGHPIVASIKGQVYYRLRVGPRKVDQFNPERKVGYFMNKSEAIKFCTNLKENGIDCFVTLTTQEKL